MIPFQRIAEASKSTGLSQFYLRNGCKNGSVPHVKCGRVYMVDVPALLQRLSGGDCTVVREVGGDGKGR